MRLICHPELRNGVGTWGLFLPNYFFPFEWAKLSCFFVCFIISCKELNIYILCCWNFGDRILPLLRDCQILFVEGYGCPFVTFPNHFANCVFLVVCNHWNFCSVISMACQWPDKIFLKYLAPKGGKNPHNYCLFKFHGNHFSLCVWPPCSPSAIKSNYRNLKHTILIFREQGSYWPCWLQQATSGMLAALPTASCCVHGGMVATM